MNTEGVLHQKIKFNDRVYLVGDIDELLAKRDKRLDDIDEALLKKQDLLVPGPGVDIKDGKISITIASVVPNVLKVKNINEGTLSEGGNIEVDNTYHVYFATVTSTSTESFTFKNLETLAGDQAYSIEFWVKISDPACRIVFTNENIVNLSDPADFRVNKANQIAYFAVRYFLGKIYINKYFVG